MFSLTWNDAEFVWQINFTWNGAWHMVYGPFFDEAEFVIEQIKAVKQGIA